MVIHGTINPSTFMLEYRVPLQTCNKTLRLLDRKIGSRRYVDNRHCSVIPLRQSKFYYFRKQCGRSTYNPLRTSEQITNQCMTLKWFHDVIYTFYCFCIRNESPTSTTSPFQSFVYIINDIILLRL